MKVQYDIKNVKQINNYHPKFISDLFWVIEWWVILFFSLYFYVLTKFSKINSVIL